MEFKRGSHLILRLKAIESIKKLLCSLSSYINLQSSNLCSPRLFSYWHYNDEGVRSDGELFDGINLIIIAFTIDLIFESLIDFQGNFTSIMNCTLGSLALLSKLAIVFTNPTFIGLICPQDNLLHSWIARLVLLFIRAKMQLWLLDHLATSLDSSAISGSLHYWKGLSFDRGLIEKLWC